MDRSLNISVVVPAYNESSNVRSLVDRLVAVLSSYYDYEVIFVDDGSSDGTLEAIKELGATNPKIKFISFSRNFGHQSALKAGLDHARYDCVVTMDADLQHPPELIHEMVKKWIEGNDVVYTVRLDTSGTPFSKRFTSRLFYMLMNSITEIHIEKGTADFRLLDRQVVDALRGLNEYNLFLRGLIPWLGFRQTSISYVPDERTSGQTKYSLGRMVSLALDGITSFSAMPLRLSMFMGLIISLGSFMYMTYALYAHFILEETVSGWTSLLICILLIGGINLIMLGVIGEYLGKVYLQGKRRPVYIIKEKNIPSHE